MRLIDADKLKEKWIWGNTDRTKRAKVIELTDIDEAPTIEAEPKLRDRVKRNISQRISSNPEEEMRYK